MGVGGVLFFFAASAQLDSHEKWLFMYYWIRQTVLGHKNLSSCCFLEAIKFFSHFIGKCQCKYAVCFEVKSREETKDAIDKSGGA